MTIDIMKRLLGITTVGPLWAPAGEGGNGGADGGNTGTEGETKTTDEGGNKAPPGEVVLGGDQTGGKPEDGTKPEGEAEKDGDAKSDEDKAKEAAEAALDAVPEDGKYQFELPPEVEFPEDKQAFWSKEFKDAGLTQRQAARMVELQASMVLAEVEERGKQLAETQEKHLKEAKADKIIGGANWDETVKLSNLGLKALGGSAIQDLILMTGNGNNPKMLQELRRIGERFKDDKFESGPTAQAPEPAEKKWYGETTPETKKG